MSFSRGVLTEEQRRRIVCMESLNPIYNINIQDENRKRAQERLNKKNGIQPAKATDTPKVSSTPVVATSQAPKNPQVLNGSTIKITASFASDRKRPRVELSDEQKKVIEAKRQKALDIKARLASLGARSDSVVAASGSGANANGASGVTPVSSINSSGATAYDTTMNSVIEIGNSVRLNNNRAPEPEPKFTFPPIQRKDYIEYDFATMEDSRGGFISEQGELIKPREPEVVKEPAPPMDIVSAPKCIECGSIELDQNLHKNFSILACRKCVKEHPEKYSLLTKTECKEDYLLTDPELKDEDLLPRIEKPNPHGFSRMLLFLRAQVEEYAWKKWGSSEGLDAEWERREAMKVKRREKRYNDLLREMRTKTRAEEYTRKLRNGVGLGERHVHDWSAPLSVPGEENMIMKRCIDCGVETEEYIVMGM